LSTPPIILARIFAVDTWGALWNLENALGCTEPETDDVRASKKKHTQILEPNHVSQVKNKKKKKKRRKEKKGW
jgi:hypothetical protein